MKEIINYLENLCENYNQMCRRKDGSTYGIEDGLNCRKGTTVYEDELSSSTRKAVDKLQMKAQGKVVRKILEEKIKEKVSSSKPSSYKDYFEIGVRAYRDEILQVKELITSVKKDRKFLDSLAKTKQIDLDDREIKARTERYNQNKEKAERIFAKIREDLLSRGNIQTAKSKAKEVIDNSDVGSLPKSKDFYQEELVNLNRISNNKVQTLGELIYTRERAFARKPKGNEVGKINVGKKETETASKTSLWHEFGHHIEISNPELKDVFKEWILSRSSGKTVSLRQLTGNQKYGEDEVAYDGKFGLGAYVGRIYPDGGTEVMSKGLEMFASEKAMAYFFSKDPEHFLMILGILNSL